MEEKNMEAVASNAGWYGDGIDFTDKKEMIRRCRVEQRVLDFTEILKRSFLIYANIKTVDMPQIHVDVNEKSLDGAAVVLIHFNLNIDDIDGNEED